MKRQWSFAVALLPTEQQMSDNIIEKKRELRKQLKERRASILIADRIRADRMLYERTVALKEYERADVILAYYPIKGELNILPIIEHALRHGKKVALPVSKTKDYSLVFRFISSLDELALGAYSIPEPPADAQAYKCECNALCIVPALSFDKEGRRIGYGKGFYDRFLSRFNGDTLGLCYSSMLSDKIPTEPTDVSVNIVITEKEEFFVNGKR